MTKVAGEPASNQLETRVEESGRSSDDFVPRFDLWTEGPARGDFAGGGGEDDALGDGRSDGAAGVSLLACVEGVGQVMEPSLAKTQELRRSESGTLHIYEAAQSTADRRASSRRL